MTAAQFITDLKTIFQDTSITDATVEILVDAVINELNLNGCEIQNMSGSAGSKTISLSQAEKGGITKIFRVFYASYYKNADNKSGGIGALSMSVQDLMSSQVTVNMIEDVAHRLREEDYSHAFC